MTDIRNLVQETTNIGLIYGIMELDRKSKKKILIYAKFGKIGYLH